MSKYDPAHDDIDELLRQVDDLLEPELPDEAYEPQQQWDDEDYFGSDGFDEFRPREEEEEPVFYQNYSNSYGQDVKNYSNGYGGQQPPAQPRYTGPSIPAYNADYQDPRTRRAPKEEAIRRKSEYRDYGESYDEPAPKPRKAPKTRRRGCGCGCTTVLLALGIMIALVVGAVMFLFQPPKSGSSIGPRKPDTATILLVGADAAADNTDTMMLLYLSGSEKQVSLLSLPRDSLTVTSSGKNAKLNSAYSRNGRGEEGIQGLMDYVENIIGYRPDGYMMVDMTVVPQIVDIMGGVDVEVPMDMEVDGVELKAGMQHLDGTQALTLLRFRKGYAMADLGRVEMQRTVLKACIQQWTSPQHIGDAFQALSLVTNETGTSLNTSNFLWMGKTLLFNMGNFTTETLPGVPEYIDGVSYYIVDLEDTADLINESYNPYQVTIDADDLSITGD